MAFITVALPAVLGIICGLTLSLVACIILGAGVASVGLITLVSTRDQEIGSLMGVVAVMVAALFNVAMWTAFALSRWGTWGVDLSWVLR